MHPPKIDYRCYHPRCTVKPLSVLDMSGIIARHSSMQRHGIGNKAMINDARFAVFYFYLKGKFSGKLGRVKMVLLQYGGH